MSFTAIKFVVNLSSRYIEVTNPRTGENSNGSIPPQGTRNMLTWVEWCRSQLEFNQSHRIDVRLTVDNGDDIIFSLWQHWRSDGDFVRYNRGVIGQPLFDSNAPPVPTTTSGAKAGGDRVLVVDDDNNIRLEVLGVTPSFVADIASREAEESFQPGSNTAQRSRSE